MGDLMDVGTHEGTRQSDGAKVVRFWAAADTWDRATISVRVNYREWLQANAGIADVIEVGAERRFRPSNPGRGIILPHVEVMIYYRDRPMNEIGRVVDQGQAKGKAKPVFADRECRYCHKTFTPTGASQRFCDRVCRAWYDVEQAELAANSRGLNNDQGGL